MNKQLQYKLLLLLGLALVAQNSMQAVTKDDKKMKASSEENQAKDSEESDEGQEIHEKMMNKIINSRTTILTNLKENSDRPYTQIIAQEIDMREQELESLKKILNDADKKSSELGSWISKETSDKDEDREALENELDIIKRMIKRRVTVVNKLEDENPRPFTHIVSDEFDFRQEEIKLLRSRKQELMGILGIDNNTSSRKKGSRKKLGKLNKKNDKKNKKDKRARKNRNNR